MKNMMLYREVSRAMRSIAAIACIACGLSMVSCSDRHVLKELEQIKATSDENPAEALAMYSSIGSDVEDAGKYARKKYELLHLILCDKAGIVPEVRQETLWRLVAFFEGKGSPTEAQEVFYYTGRTFRKLQNTAGAFECFFYSLYQTTAGECDSALLLNTFTNLYELHCTIHDYSHALIASDKELRTCWQMRRDVVPAYIHIGESYLCMDSTRRAEEAFDSAYAHIIRSDNGGRYRHSLVRLLRGYSLLSNTGKAAKCRELTEEHPQKDSDCGSHMAFAYYYMALGDYESARTYGKQAFDEETDIGSKHEAARSLYHICKGNGDETGAAFYLEKSMLLRDSLDTKLTQEIIKAGHRHYQLLQNRKEEKEVQGSIKAYVITAILLIVLVFVIHIIYKENWHRRIVDSLSSEIEEKEQMLAEKEEKNQALISIIHQSELEDKAEDIMNVIRQCAAGKREMTPADWRQVYRIVDELDQTFREQLLKELGIITDNQMQIVYLMRMGLPNSQIENLTNLSRQTIWRWRKKYLAFGFV